MNLKKYYKSLLSGSSELTTLLGEGKIVSAYPQEVKIFPLVVFEDLNSADVAFSDNLPEGTSAQVRIHVFSKTVKGYPKAEDIADVVLMPGDPLRAKYIAENFLENYKLVNSVRGMYAYTGTYRGKEITVMAHGMGIPSIGIYCYELYKIYGVENIIRIGSCGAYLPGLKLFDIVLSEYPSLSANCA